MGETVNRREFLKGGIAGVCGALGFWLTRKVLKAEEPDTLVVGIGRPSAQIFTEPLGITSADIREAMEEQGMIYQWFYAKHDSDRVATVTVDGKGVTSDCVSFYGPSIPSVSGWGMAVMLDQFIPDNDGGHWETKGITGNIQWEEF